MFFIKFLRPKHVLCTMLLLIFWCTLLIKFALIQMTRGCSDDSAVENAKETGNLHGHSIRLVELLSARVHLLTAPLRPLPMRPTPRAAGICSQKAGTELLGFTELPAVFRSQLLTFLLKCRDRNSKACNDRRHKEGMCFHSR
jgi:hypothetical protein